MFKATFWPETFLCREKHLPSLAGTNRTENWVRKQSIPEFCSLYLFLFSLNHDMQER